MVRLALTAIALFGALALTSLTDLASAHPGEQHRNNALSSNDAAATTHAQRKLFKTNAHRSLKACTDSPHARKLKERAIARRTATLRQLRQANIASNNNNNNNNARQLSVTSTVLATSHKSNLTGVTTATDAATLFGADPKCILEPEVTQGPYYVSGELIRTDVRESQAGVDLYAELQFIDVNTCEPVVDLYVDFWHCNATGVYSGIVASGNGNSADLTNVNNTFLRGLAPTDADGLVSFTTTFPGHYTSRATHIHVLGSHDGAVLANGTYAGGKAASVGQLFFDQDLITEVEQTAAYAVNKQETTLNSADKILAEETAGEFDPVMEYALLGDSVEDGVFAWISIGVDTTVAKSVTGAATLTASGGVMASISGASGGNGGNGSDFGGPSGSAGGMGSMGSAPPSGSAGGEFAAGSAGSTSTATASTTTTTTTTTATPTVTTATPTSTTSVSACVKSTYSLASGVDGWRFTPAKLLELLFNGHVARAARQKMLITTQTPRALQQKLHLCSSDAEESIVIAICSCSWRLFSLRGGVVGEGGPDPGTSIDTRNVLLVTTAPTDGCPYIWSFCGAVRTEATGEVIVIDASVFAPLLSIAAVALGTSRGTGLGIRAKKLFICSFGATICLGSQRDTVDLGAAGLIVHKIPGSAC